MKKQIQFQFSFAAVVIPDSTTEEKDSASAYLAINADYPDLKKIKASAKKYAKFLVAEQTAINTAYATSAQKLKPLSDEILSYYQECLSEGMDERVAKSTARSLYTAALIEEGAPKRSVQRYFERFLVTVDGEEVSLFKMRNTGARTAPATVAKRAISSAKEAGCTLVDLLKAARKGDLKVGSRAELLELIAELAPAKA